MLWQVLNLKRYFVWICQDSQVNHARLKAILLISLISKVFRFINVDFMELRTQTSMGLGTEPIEVGLIS